MYSTYYVQRSLCFVQRVIIIYTQTPLFSIDILGEEQRATTYYISATGNEFRLRGVNFSNNSHIYSVDAYIYNLQTIEKREVSQEMDGDACVLIFIGENDDIVLVANTIL